jgi:hypothetical protein
MRKAILKYILKSTVMWRFVLTPLTSVVWMTPSGAKNRNYYVFGVCVARRQIPGEY